jgi:putative transposase
MAITLQLKQNQTIELPTGLYRFVQERPGDILLLQREDTGLDLPVREDRLISMLGAGKARIIDFCATPDHAGKTGPNDNGEFGPNEVWIDEDDPDAGLTAEGQRALALQFYARKWDDEPHRSLGEKSLQELINTWRPVAIQLKLEPKDRHDGYWVQPARLKFSIQNCGEPGNRPLRMFRSRRGKTGRKRYDMFVEKALDDAVAYYWSERAYDYNDAYARFRMQVDDFNKTLTAAGMPALRFPTRIEVLRRRITAAANFITWSQKYSAYEAHRRFKGVKPGPVATRPLELVIMDHTILDTWTVLDTETFLPLGRPTLTVAIDVATRMILGYLVSFEPASLYSVLTTLKRVNKNKRYIKKLYPDIDGSWDGWGRPEEILVDNGWEFKAPSLQRALKDLGTSITWAPVRTPQYKAIGERFFGTLNVLLHKLPGSVPYPTHIMRQLDLDPRNSAILTLGDLDHLMHQAIITYQAQVHTGLRGIPARVWRDKIRIHRRPFIRDINAINAILGRAAKVRLTTSGVRFKNMQFHEDAVTTGLLDDLVKHAPKRDLSDKTNASGRINVQIKWNPADASSISVWNPERRHYVTLRNRDQKFFQGLSFWHWDKIMEFAAKQDLDFNSEHDRWKAREDLSALWQKLSGLRLMRESRDARRGLAQSQGQFDDSDVNLDADIDLDTIHEVYAEPSTDGLNTPLVPDDVLSVEDEDDRAIPPGRKPSKSTVNKIQKTKGRKKQEEEEKNEANDERRRRGNPTGLAEGADPAKPGVDANELPGGPLWGDRDAEVDKTGETTPKPNGKFRDLPKGKAWGDK